MAVNSFLSGENFPSSSVEFGVSNRFDVLGVHFSVVARSNTILKQLVLQAKREYEAEAIHRIQIYFADSHGSWRWTDSRHKRPMGSIVLNPGVKEMLLEDTKDFLRSEKVCIRPPQPLPTPPSLSGKTCYPRNSWGVTPTSKWSSQGPLIPSAFFSRSVPAAFVLINSFA